MSSGACLREYVIRRGAILLTITIVAIVGSAAEAAAGNCPNANPNDGASDSFALQWCLNNLNTVVLDPGSPGYIVNTTLSLTRNNQVITSSKKPIRATII